MGRSPVLQNLLDKLAESAGIPQAVVIGADHAYECTCKACLGYWASMPPEDEGELRENDYHGPFTWRQIWEYQDKNGMERTEGYIYDEPIDFDEAP